jgi:hypothetical protein
MALELQYILGTSPEHSAITLYGFMQQNILFDAFSKKLANIDGTPLEFLSEITTVFSMIGMLVLIFSPSLWKAKYLISWIFLFVAITLGGSTGGTFGYNLNDASNRSILDKKIDDNNICTKENLVNGVCATQPASQEIINAYLASKSTVETVKQLEVEGNNKIVLNGGKVEILDIMGFLPQVYIIYATNRFRNSLESALYDLNSRNFSIKKQQLQIMLEASVPNPQLNMWISTFDKLCSSSAGASTPTIISSSSKSIANLSNSELLNKNFTVRDLVPVINNGKLLEGSGAYMLSPLMDVVTPNTNNQANLDALYSFVSSNSIDGGPSGSSTFDALKQYTINYPERTVGEFDNRIRSADSTLDPVDEKDQLLYYTNLNTDDSMQYIKEQIALAAISKNSDPENYINNGILLASKGINNVEAALLLPQYLTSKSDLSSISIRKNVAERDDEDDDKFSLSGNPYKEAHENRVNDNGKYTSNLTNGCKSISGNISCALDYINNDTNNVVNKPNGSFQLIPNCSRFLVSLSDYYKNSIKIDNSDFYKKVKSHQSVFSKIFWGDISVPKDLKAQASFLQQLEIMTNYCQEKTGFNYSNTSDNIELNKCSSQYIDPIVKHYQSAAIENSLSTSNRKISQKYADQANSLTSGLSGAGYFVGKNFTDAFTAPLAGIASIGKAFQAGAYSHILPIIKNIIIAFILICTPILFVLGLLVPSWAPGVILTSIITLLFLQMTDVIMVLVQTILISVEQPIKAIVDSDSSLEYQSFMEVIWGMAYMSAFAITAFLMFAAGNTKAIMSKMAGLDGTVKSVSQDIYRNGWNLTKQGIGMALPGMGNTLISSNGAFKATTGALGSLTSGTMTSPMAEWSHAIQSKAISSAKDNNKINADLESTYDPASKKQTSSMKATHNQEVALEKEKYSSTITNADKDMQFAEKMGKAHDSRVDDKNKLLEDSIARSNRKARDKDANASEKDIASRATESALTRAEKDQGVNKDFFKSVTTSKLDASGKNMSTIVNKSPRDIIRQDLEKSVRNSMGYKSLPQKFNDNIPNPTKQGSFLSKSEYDLIKAKNSQILRESSTATASIAQGIYKHMDKDNIHTDGKGNMSQKFASYSDIEASIKNNAKNSGINENMAAQAAKDFFKSKTGNEPKGPFSMKYEPEIKNTKPSRNSSKKGKK